MAAYSPRAVGPRVRARIMPPSPAAAADARLNPAVRATLRADARSPQRGRKALHAAPARGARGSQALDVPHLPLRAAKVRFWVTIWPRSVPVSAASAILQHALTNFHTATRAALSKPCATGGQGSHGNRGKARRCRDLADTACGMGRLVREVAVANPPPEGTGRVRHPCHEDAAGNERVRDPVERSPAPQPW